MEQSAGATSQASLDGGRVVAARFDERSEYSRGSARYSIPGSIRCFTRSRRACHGAQLPPAPGGPAARAYASLHERGFVDALLLKAGLRPVERRTVGFGPHFLFRSALLPAQAAHRAPSPSQRPGRSGRAGLRRLAPHFILMAERKPTDAGS